MIEERHINCGEFTAVFNPEEKTYTFTRAVDAEPTSKYGFLVEVLNSTMDFDCASYEYCLGNSMMAINLYDFYTGLLFAVNFEQMAQYAEGKDVVIYGKEPDESDIEDMIEYNPGTFCKEMFHMKTIDSKEDTTLSGEDKGVGAPDNDWNKYGEVYDPLVNKTVPSIQDAATKTEDASIPGKKECTIKFTEDDVKTIINDILTNQCGMVNGNEVASTDIDNIMQTIEMLYKDTMLAMKWEELFDVIYIAGYEYIRNKIMHTMLEAASCYTNYIRKQL